MIKLFCLPYAGGTTSIYSNWRKHLSSEIELVPIELAGKGKRFNEPLYDGMPSLKEDVFNIIGTQIMQPYAFFGHSMGAMICYDLTQEIKNRKLPLPMHLFCSGRSAPHVKRDNKNYHLMSNEEFKREVLALGGTPPEFFEHEELQELFLPALKNDFMLSECNVATGEIDPLDLDLTVFLGKEEDLSPEQCDGWKKHSRRLVSVHYFEGGHFFLHNEIGKIVELINHALLEKLPNR